MLTENLKIFKVTAELIHMLTEHTRHINREVKFSDYADLRKKVYDAIDAIYLANRDEATRVTHLQDFLFYIYGAKHRIRILGESGYLKVSFKTELIRKIDECARQATAWRDYTTQRQNRGVKQNE